MFEDLFIDRGTIASHWTAPLLEERLSYLIAQRRGYGHPHCAGLRLIRPAWFVFWTCVKPSVSACPGSRRWPGNGRGAVGADCAAAPLDRRHVRASSATRYGGCASPVCSKNLARCDTPTPVRSRSSRRGCVKSAGGPKRRSAVTAIRSTASSISWTNTALIRLLSGSPMSIGLSRAGTPAAAAGSPSVITRSTSAPFSGSPNPGAGAYRGWPTGSCRCGSIPVRQSRRG